MSHPSSVIEWLLEGEPEIRWQGMRDLTTARSEAIAAERARVAREGLGARLLDEQRADGQWGDGFRRPFWRTNLFTPLMLRSLGVDPTDARVRRMVALLRERVTWGPEWNDSPFFEGE